jgi:small subunit ribosomal protein S19
MSRSKWKGPFINFKNLESFNLSYKKNLIFLMSRNSLIIPKFVGHTFKVHSGNSFVEIQIVKEMVNHKFGEFISTRKNFSFKKKKKKMKK